MDDLQRRFRRLDRVVTPNLWNEAVGRAAELELGSRRTFNPAMGLIAAALLLAALAGTVAVGAWLNRPSPIPEAVTYDNGLIVGGERCGRIVALHPTSFATQELVAGSDCDSWAGDTVWSSDGSRLVYTVSGLTEEHSTWVYDAATGDARQLDDCLNCGLVDISSDGSLVASIDVGTDGSSALVVTEVDSGDQHRVALAGSPRHPRFSPDGSRIAVPLVGGRSGIYVVDVAGLEDGEIGDPILLFGIIEADGVAWSPDGEWLAYTQSGGLGRANGPVPFNGQGGHADDGIVVTRTDGSETRVLATGPTDIGPKAATWSPDSASLAYVTTPTPEGAQQPWMIELWTVAIDGGEPTRIYESGCCADLGGPDWSPDGEWIAFGVSMSAPPSQTGTYLVRPDGSDLRQVSDRYVIPAWQPLPED